MAFGSVLPRRRARWLHPIEALVYRVFGWPNFLRRLQWRDFFALLAADAGMTVLDLGAGSMQYSVELARRTGARLIAIDLDLPEGCGPWAARKGISALRADALRLPLASRSVDRVMMSSLLHMVADPARLLAECQRVLRPGGFIVLSVTNHYQDLPRLYARFGRGWLWRALGVPQTCGELTALLKDRFHISGPSGHYSRDEVSALIHGNRFRIESHRYVPGRLGSFLWEMGVLAYTRLGVAPIYLLFLLYPLARLYDLTAKTAVGCEHVIKAVPDEG